MGSFLSTMVGQTRTRDEEIGGNEDRVVMARRSVLQTSPHSAAPSENPAAVQPTTLQEKESNLRKEKILLHINSPGVRVVLNNCIYRVTRMKVQEHNLRYV